MKTACILQGNIRTNAHLVRDEMLKHFDLVIISTWKGEEENITAAERCIVLFNDIPPVAGYAHRNFQRYSTSEGIKKAKELGCDYVMKWRTDMLPLKLNVADLIEKAHWNCPRELTSRIVTCAFRNLTVEPDWFSSIPDIFAFGHISAMQLLWGDEEFDYSQRMNLPPGMLTEVGTGWTADVDPAGYFCPESELYAIFKMRLESLTKSKLRHEEIVKRFFSLIDHRTLQIIWFGPNGSFRPILAVYFPWWTVNTWMGRTKARKIPSGYPASDLQRKLIQFKVSILTYYHNVRQWVAFHRYLKKS